MSIRKRPQLQYILSACKAAGVPFADYKEARFLVYGLNTAA